MGVSNLEYLLFFRASLIALSGIFFHYIYELKNNTITRFVPVLLFGLFCYYTVNLQRSYVYIDEIEDEKYRVIEYDDSSEFEAYENLFEDIETYNNVLFEDTFYNREYSHATGKLATSSYIPVDYNFSAIYTFDINLIDESISIPISNETKLEEFVKLYAIEYIVCYSDEWKTSFLEFGSLAKEDGGFYLIQISPIFLFYSYNSSIVNRTASEFYVDFGDNSYVILPVRANPQIHVYVGEEEISYTKKGDLVRIESDEGIKKVEIKYKMTNIEIFSQILTIIFIVLAISIFLIDRLMQASQKSISELIRDFLRGLTRAKM